MEMKEVKAFGAQSAEAPLNQLNINRRAVTPQDVGIEILYCGICHSDVHQARDEWGGSIFPMVPGHEIVGIVERVGASVKQFKVGQLVGVGSFVDSCRTCTQCKKGQEQYCDGHLSFTYNGTERDGITPTYGGYSTKVVVDQRYVLRIPKQLRPEEAAPLLCAGITTYSPLRHVGVGKNHRLAVVGLGGLGHMAVKIGTALGAHVTVLSHSDKKRCDAKRLGAGRRLHRRAGAQGQAPHLLAPRRHSGVLSHRRRPLARHLRPRRSRGRRPTGRSHTGGDPGAASASQRA